MTDPMQTRLADRLQEEVGDGVRWRFCSADDRPALWQALPAAEVYVGSVLTPEMSAIAPRLRLAQVAGAGYDSIATEALPPGAVLATTSHHGPAIAEYVIMAALALTRDLLGEDRALRSGHWRSVFHNPRAQVHPSLRSLRMGIVGLGEIGGSIARLARSFGMRVAAVRSRPELGPPAGVDVDWLGSSRDLPRLLRESDVVVITVPLSEGTVGLIGESELAQLAPSAVLINVSRGAVVDEHSLFQALRQHRIAGAALDVWWKYPDGGPDGRPSTLPFHELDNVIMTPHTSGVTDDVFTARAADVAHNIKAVRDGTPLRNVVDATRNGTPEVLTPSQDTVR